MEIIENGIPVKYKDRTEWLLRGKLHRIDGPAIIYNNGIKEWWVNDKRHRLDGPAILFPSGYEEWYNNDVRHRLDGPAATSSWKKIWWVNGKLHRTDGPAIETEHEKCWFYEGVQIYEESLPIIKKLFEFKTMISVTLETIKNSHADTGENDDYYNVPKALVNVLLEKIDS